MCSWVWDSIMPLFSRNLPEDWKRWKARWERSQGGKAGAQGQVAVNCFFLSLLLLYSLWHLHPLLPSSTSFPGLWHEIPHMPLIWNDAAQEWSYLTAVEFSTLASDMSHEKQLSKRRSGVYYRIGEGGDGCPWEKSKVTLASVCSGLCLPGSASERGRMER